MPDGFRILLQQRKTQYRTLPPVFSPAIREYIVFTMQGFNHLRFKIDNTPRAPKEAMYKLGLLPLVKAVISTATTVERNQKRVAPIGGSRKKILKEIEYWALVSVVGKRQTKVRVIVRRIGNSPQVHFWSVMKIG